MSHLQQNVRIEKISRIVRVKKWHPRGIGYRGRHDHGHIGDPVYPVKKMPHELMQHHGIDWKNAGRNLLLAGMAMMEDKRLRTPGQLKNYQKSAHCGERCEHQCCKSSDRIYCSWKVPGSLWEMINRKDGHLVRYKGEIKSNAGVVGDLNMLQNYAEMSMDQTLEISSNTASSNTIAKANMQAMFKPNTEFPIFTVLKQPGVPNKYKGLPYVEKDGSLCPFLVMEDYEAHPAFGINPDLENSKGYSREEDIEMEDKEDPEAILITES